MLLTTKPGPHARSSRLHPRLTVALAPNADRARVIEALPGIAIGPEQLWDAGNLLAAERSAERSAVRSRLDAVAARALHDVETGRSQCEQLERSRVALLEGAAWAAELEVAVAALQDDVEVARATLEQRHIDQRTARQALDRVLEQRAAAAAAIEDADRELSELVGVGMDETGLRRELEASGQAVRAAQQHHQRAVARIEELRAEHAALELEIAAIEGAPTGTPAGIDPALVDRVRDLVAQWNAEAAVAGLDPQGQLLADAWTDLAADLTELIAGAVRVPTRDELAAAEARVAAAARELESLGAAKQPLDPALRRALDAAHEAVLAAEERIGRRVGAAGARKRLDTARETERALLDRYGFASYVDVVLTGGRAPTDDTARLAAERDYLAATDERDALVAAMRVSPELEYLRSEQARLLALTVDLLGVDPADDPIALLRVHPLLPRRIVGGLRDALEVAGVRPVGVSLAEAATDWVGQQDAAANERDRRREASGQRAVQLAAVTARQVDLVDELAAAEQAEAHAAEQLELALRSVGAFEAELSVRAGEDAQRLQRFAAAEQLRTQVDALSATLARAESDARDAVDRTTTEVTEAEVSLDRLTATITDHARRARRLAAELPIDQRPEGEPLATLSALADRLQAHAAVIEPEIRAAEAALARATTQLDDAVVEAHAASTGLEGALADDLCDGFRATLAANVDDLIVLNDPFDGLDQQLRHDLLVLVLEHVTRGPVVLLTEDPALLGWAIELPADVASAVPVDALFANALRRDASDADLTTEPEAPAPTRRRAGRR